MIVLRLMALGRCSRGTRLGRSAWRAGPSEAPAAAPTPAMRRTSQGRARPANVRSASPAAASAIATCATSMSRRRSNASAITPLHSPKTKMGPTRARPTRPSARAFHSGGARIETCQRSAAVCIIEPDIETSWPSHRRRKFRWRRRSEGRVVRRRHALRAGAPARSPRTPAAAARPRRRRRAGPRLAQEGPALVVPPAPADLQVARREAFLPEAEAPHERRETRGYPAGCWPPAGGARAAGRRGAGRAPRPSVMYPCPACGGNA